MRSHPSGGPGSRPWRWTRRRRFAAAIRRALPDATIVVDDWHLVRLANAMLTEVRQRVTRDQHPRCGRKTDLAWAHRTLLLRAGGRLSKPALAKLVAVLAADDPTNEIGAAWGCKELLRQLLAPADRAEIRARLWAFYDACATAGQTHQAPAYFLLKRVRRRPTRPNGFQC